MAETKKITKDQLTTPRISVYIVHLACPNCGEEIEDIKLCPKCNKPMRVIDVVEKFGDEAQALLDQVKKQIPATEQDEDFEDIDREEPNIILMGNEETIDDGGIDPASIDDDSGLDVIFPNDEENPDGGAPVEAMGDDDLSKALDQLDEEEDTSADDFGLGDDGVPEL